MPMLQVEVEITLESKDVPLSGSSCVYLYGQQHLKKKSVMSRLKDKVS